MEGLASYQVIGPGRPDDLQLSASIWDQAMPPRRMDSQQVITTLYEAVKQLEAELVALRTGWLNGLKDHLHSAQPRSLN